MWKTVWEETRQESQGRGTMPNNLVAMILKPGERVLAGEIEGKWLAPVREAQSLEQLDEPPELEF